MKLPSFKRILKNDYAKQYQDLVEKLAYSINYGIEVINDALNHNVSLGDNIKCTVKDLTLQVNSSGSPVTPINFPVSFSGRVVGLSVLNVINSTNSAGYPTSWPGISFTQTQTGISINNITGLQPNNTYILTVVAWG